MTCPKCRTTMRLTTGQNPEYFCGGCGGRKPAPKGSPSSHLEAFTPPPEKPKSQPPPPPPEPMIDDAEFERPKPSEKASGSKKKNRPNPVPQAIKPPEVTTPPTPIVVERPLPPKPDRSKELAKLAELRRSLNDSVTRLRKTENELKEKLRETTSELETLQLSFDELEEWIKKS